MIKSAGRAHNAMLAEVLCESSGNWLKAVFD
jgi:hypothetical protein